MNADIAKFISAVSLKIKPDHEMNPFVASNV